MEGPAEKDSTGNPRKCTLTLPFVGRLLFLVFTIREELIRVISARDMSRREKKEYERAQSEAANSKNAEA
ncbi:MAG: BrnT family toxin [Candidatus Methylomirabilales bacterium]